MRILIPCLRTPDNFTDNVAHTLEKMGHTVLTLPAPELPRPLARLQGRYEDLMRRARRDHVPASERTALALARETRPELVLSLTTQLTSETLRDFRRLGVRQRVVWWGDCPGNMQQMGLYDDEWDALFVKDADFARKLRRAGLNGHLLHEAHNPSWHRPIASVANDRVVVAGNLYGHRQFLLRRLLERGVRVELYGPPAPRWVDPIVASIHTNRYVVRDDKSRAFSEGLACLNSMSEREGNSLNCRAFEIAGAGGLQIMEYRPMIEACFEPGKELLVFDSLPELLEHIERARRAPVEVQKIREAGARRAQAEHTYRHRLATILGSCA
jgi:spore maturation protein CgeB